MEMLKQIDGHADTSAAKFSTATILPLVHRERTHSQYFGMLRDANGDLLTRFIQIGQR